MASATPARTRPSARPAPGLACRYTRGSSLTLPISNSNVEDPVVLERLIRGFDCPRSDADDQNPVSLRDEFGRRWVCRFHLFGRLLKHSRQFRAPAVRAGQRPVLARNDPLNIFGNQRQQTLLIAAAHCCEEILHNLNILFDAHRILSVFLTSDCVRSNRREFRWPRSRRRQPSPSHSRSSNRLKPETARPSRFPRDDPSFPAGSGIRTSASPRR